MRVTKLTVGKGNKTKLTEKEEQTTYFQLEMEITDQNEVERARAKALKLMEKWLKTELETGKTKKRSEPNPAIKKFKKTAL